MDDTPGHGRPSCSRGNIMNLVALHNLLNRFAEEKRHLEATALLTDDPGQQAGLELRTRKLTSIVAEIRGELLAREMCIERAPGTAQWFEARLRHILKTDVAPEAGRDADLRQAE